MKKYYFILVVMLLVWGACENDPYLYNDVNRLWLSGEDEDPNEMDSLFYSFRLYESDVMEADINLIVNLTGMTSNVERHFQLEVVDSMTNVPAEAYQIGETVFPANAFQVVVPVTVQRHIEGLDLTTENAKLTLRVISGGDFEPSVEEADTYSLVWCDYLVKPESWVTYIDGYIGPFTQARYKFIIDYMGITDFTDYANDMNLLFWLQGRLIELLEEYNADPANEGREEGWPYQNDNGDPLQFGSNLME